MKKRIFLCIALLMSAVCIPVHAASDYNLIYDATEMLDSDYCEQMGNDTLPGLSEDYETQFRVDIVEDLEGNSIAEYAQIFYDQYEYGYGDTKDGILLMLYLTIDDTGLEYHDYYLLAGGQNKDILYNLASEMADNMSGWLNEDAWSASIEDDNAAFENAMQAFADSIAEFDASAYTAADTQMDTQTNADTGYVQDYAMLLSNEQAEALEAKAAKIAQTYECGVYIVTVNDYNDYSYDIYEAAKTIYNDSGLGYGEDKSGVLLLLSMLDRDYSLVAYGYGNTAFTDYGKEQLEEEFLDDFGDDEWESGFNDYLTGSADMLKSARAGKPVDVGSNPLIMIVGTVFNLLLGAGIAAGIVLLLKAQMESVAEKEEAEAYVPNNGITMSRRSDHFLYSTETRTVIKDNSSSSSSGGTSVDSDGFSGSSGKF